MIFICIICGFFSIIAFITALYSLLRIKAIFNEKNIKESVTAEEEPKLMKKNDIKKQWEQMMTYTGDTGNADEE